jgi:hypothetical protein
MSRSKHTKGPWQYADGVVFDAKGSIADCVDSDRDQAEQDANAQLIASSPDLLEACQRALREIKDGETTIGLEEDLIAAIAKAKGK